MHEVLAISLRSIQQDISHVQSIAMNMSNAQTPGYKREVLSAAPFLGHLQQAAVDAAVPEQSLTMALDMRPGTLRTTGQPLDLALTGEGLFEVENGAGRSYTRNGNFHVDVNGRLVTARGESVIGKAGPVYLPSGPVSVDGKGNIHATADMLGDARQPLAQLHIVRPADGTHLERRGEGLFDASGAMQPLADVDIAISAGQLENSNAGSLQEMVQLMQTMRHLESVQKMVQGYDEMLGTAIRKLGEA